VAGIFELSCVLSPCVWGHRGLGGRTKHGYFFRRPAIRMTSSTRCFLLLAKQNRFGRRAGALDLNSFLLE